MHAIKMEIMPTILNTDCLTLEQGEKADCAYDKVSIEVKGQHTAQGRIPTALKFKVI